MGEARREYGIADHGAQPLAMLRYAIHYNGVDWSKIKVHECGDPRTKMVSAFHNGKGHFHPPPGAGATIA